MHDNSMNRYVDGHFFFFYWNCKYNLSCSEDATFISEIKRQTKRGPVNYVLSFALMLMEEIHKCKQDTCRR